MGGNGPLIVQIFGVLLILFFCFLVYMFTKTWRWHHVTLALFVFAATLTFLTFTSMSLKTHASWQQIYNKLSADLETELSEIQRLEAGDPADPASAEETIRALKGQVTRILLDRGRVWRGCSPLGAQQNSIRLNTVPVGTPAGEETANLLQPKDVVYAFSEIDVEGTRLPNLYLGEFQVVSVTDTEATISPTLPLDSVQIQAINQPGSTWVLYEVMPLDSHFAFPDTQPDDDHLFGSIVAEDQPTTDAQLGVWYKNRYPDVVPDEVFAANVKKYLLDGKTLQQDDVYPPENVWVRLRFTKPFSVNVDSDESLGALEGNYFDGSGRAVDSSLRLGDEVKFGVGDEAVFPDTGKVDQLRTVKDLYSDADPDAPCDRLRRVYVRPLHDYQFVFHNVFDRHKEIQYDSYLIERDNKELEAAIAKLEKDIAYREQERGKLQDDLAQFTVEKNTTEAYHRALSAKWSAMRQRINELYRTNKLLSQQLTEAHDRLKLEIDRRTAAATAAARP